MIPMILKMKILNRSGRKTTLYLPLFLLWILLLPLFILIFAILLIAGIIAWAAGHRYVLIIIPLVISCTCNLKGLLVDVESRDETIYMEFM